MGKKYIGSFVKVTKGKSATFGFKEKSFDTLEEFADKCLREAWIPVTVPSGHREYDSVTSIHGWLRFDCDVRGEKETITSVLDSKGLAYMCLPSTNYNTSDKNYKYHISVPLKGQSSDPMQYKWQMKQALIELGVDLHDRRVTEVCVQNMNPYRNGNSPIEGMQHTKVVEGSRLTLKTPPKDIHYSEMTKTIFNGEGSQEVIPKKVKFASESLEVLSPESGIKIEKIGWVQLKDLNLDVGGMIGGLSCPAHNMKHNNGKGGHQTGYAFATMNEGGDVWVTCTGAECKGKSYKVDYDDFGANTKLSDLYELRQIVSLSAYNYDKSSIYNIRNDGSFVFFRWKEIFDYWTTDLFWKLSMTLTEENAKEVSSLNKKKKKHIGNIGKMVELDKKIEAIKLENEYEIVREALNNDRQFDIFKNKYKPKYTGDIVTTYPHELYINEIVDNIGRYIKTEKQFSSIEYEVDPFSTEVRGRVESNKFVITVNALVKEWVSHKPKQAIIDDYKDHNPYLDDILEMIVAQKFGADRKSSYLWLKADSNWGKSFLFDGMMGNLGYSINESETKNAVKGLPSGIEPNDVVKSSFLFFDEFKGAVSELKNITFSMTITPKFKGKHIVPVFMKIFCSAEDISSLNGASGMEEQFRNRFLHINVGGSLLERQLYLRDVDEYGKSVASYINHKMWELERNYVSLGRILAKKRANERYSAMINTYSIKHTSRSLDDSLNEMFSDWVQVVRSKVWSKGLVEHATYRDVLLFHKTTSEVFFTNMAKLKDVFIEEYVSNEEKTSIYHKTISKIVGETKRSSIKIRGLAVHAHRYNLVKES